VGFAGAAGRTVPSVLHISTVSTISAASSFPVSFTFFFPDSGLRRPVPEKWKEDGDQDVLEGRMAHSPNSEKDSGNLKLDEEADDDGHGLGPSSSPKSF
jgi:hypothetical protein